jgi:hypothetical protein
MKIKLLSLLAAVLFFYSCGKYERVLPAVTGSQFELLIVINDTLWKAPAGRELSEFMGAEMIGLPQPEPVMEVHQCNKVEFTDVLKSARNILYVEVSEKYTSPKITYSKDKWAYPQAIVRVVAASDSSFQSTIRKYGKNIQDYYIKAERDRQIEFNKNYINEVAKAEIEKQFGIQVDIPQGISKATTKKDFYWITNNQAGLRQDLVIYSYPYTDKKMFSKEAIIFRRDSIMKANIPGELKGSYMGTELKYSDPVFSEIWMNEGYCAELRGLWRMFNGASMGGPFYSQTRLDEVNQRVITIEAFVFGPGHKKRNAIRQLEAVVFTSKLPHEINAIKEVSVVAKKK